MVFNALYPTALTSRYSDWISKTRASIDEFAEWYDEQYRQNANNPEVWAGVQDAAARWRSELEKKLALESDHCAAEIGPPDRAVGDPSHLDSIANVERDVVRLVYQHEIASPILARFDERVRSVGGGK